MESNKPIIPNDEVFRYYFYFIQERMNMFGEDVKVSVFLQKTQYFGNTSLPMYIGFVIG